MINIKSKLKEYKNVKDNKLLSYFGKHIKHSSLFSFNKRSMSKGVAIGVFFAFITPIAQIPLSIIFSILFRANIPASILATFINTPFTFPFVYFSAWYVGNIMLGMTPDSNSFVFPNSEMLSSWIIEMGKPLFYGTLLFATFFSTFFYFLTYFYYHIKIIKRKNNINKFKKNNFGENEIKL